MTDLYDPLMRTRALVIGSLLVVAAAAAYLALPVLWMLFDEDAVPSVASLPALPEDAHVSLVDQGCGSGGCWLELTVEAPAGMTGEELVVRVVPLAAPGQPSCTFQGPLDLRRVCTGVMDAGGHSARFSVQYDRSLGT
jgi:hypothetical protein